MTILNCNCKTITFQFRYDIFISLTGSTIFYILSYSRQVKLFRDNDICYRENIFCLYLSTTRMTRSVRKRSIVVISPCMIRSSYFRDFKFTVSKDSGRWVRQRPGSVHPNRVNSTR